MMCAGKSPGLRQAQALSGVQVVFAAAAAASFAAAGPASKVQGGGQSPTSRPAPRKGLRSRPAGSTRAPSSQAEAASPTQPSAAAAQPGSNRDGSAGAGSGTGSGTGGSSAGSGSSNLSEPGGGSHGGIQQAGAAAGEVPGSDVMTAVQLAEELSRGRRPGEPHVAIGILEPAPPKGERARKTNCPSTMLCSCCGAAIGSITMSVHRFQPQTRLLTRERERLLTDAHPSSTSINHRLQLRISAGTSKQWVCIAACRWRRGRDTGAGQQQSAEMGPCGGGRHIRPAACGASHSAGSGGTGRDRGRIHRGYWSAASQEEGELLEHLQKQQHHEIEVLKN